MDSLSSPLWLLTYSGSSYEEGGVKWGNGGRLNKMQIDLSFTSDFIMILGLFTPQFTCYCFLMNALLLDSLAVTLSWKIHFTPSPLHRITPCINRLLNPIPGFLMNRHSRQTFPSAQFLRSHAPLPLMKHQTQWLVIIITGAESKRRERGGGEEEREGKTRSKKPLWDRITKN